MNSDEIKSLAIKIALMVLSPLAAKLHIDGSTGTAIVTDVVDLAILAYGVYDHRGMKKVPEDARIVAPNSAAQQAGGR